MTLALARLRRGLSRNLPVPVRLLTLALLVGGGIGCAGNLLLTPDGLWVWTMPQLAQRFLAAAAAAYVLGSLVALSSTRWVESELLFGTVVLYGVPLIGAIVLAPAQIDWQQPIAWAFVVVVTPALLISLVTIWRQRPRARREALQALTGLQRWFLAAL